MMLYYLVMEIATDKKTQDLALEWLLVWSVSRSHTSAEEVIGTIAKKGLLLIPL
jgi:hypothetical protein